MKTGAVEPVEPVEPPKVGENPWISRKNAGTMTKKMGEDVRMFIITKS